MRERSGQNPRKATPNIVMVTADPKRTGRLIVDVSKGKRSLSALYSPEPMERVALVRHGLPGTIVSVFSSGMGVTKEWVYGALGVPRATATRKVSHRGQLGSAATERALCIAGLIQQVEGLTAQADAPGFNASSWVARWLDRAHPALGSRPPADFLDTDDGRDIVTRLLGQMATGSYA
jgi:uncharacterized protein (DUF2384 family)